ncbi:MAG: thioredoxin family protein [Pseudomonadota bacterium]
MALLDTPVCDFGWQAPDFTLNDPAGVSFNMQDNLGTKGMLIAFICNHCPYVKAIADRLAADTEILLGEGVGVVAVMSNDYSDYPEDAPPKMLEFAAKHGFNFPYLVDDDQRVGKNYGAVCTPDFFGLNAKSELQYRGRLDDVGMGANASGRTPELLNAMRMIAETGEGPGEQTPSMGCSIKWS